MIDTSSEMARRSTLFAFCCLFESSTITNKVAEKIYSNVSSVVDLEEDPGEHPNNNYFNQPTKQIDKQADKQASRQTEIWQREFVKTSLRLYTKYKSSALFPQRTKATDTHFLESEIDLVSWGRFKGQSNSFEFLTVIWALVLKIELDVIADMTKTSLGTVQYRLSRGVQKLGHEIGPKSYQKNDNTTDVVKTEAVHCKQ